MSAEKKNSQYCNNIIDAQAIEAGHVVASGFGASASNGSAAATSGGVAIVGDVHGDVNVGGETPKRPFLAPPEPPYELVGRDELLSQLKERLFASDYVALNGLPGVGKTALAVALAHDPEVLAHFKDGVLWAGLGRKPDVATQLDKWGMALGIPSDEMAKLTEIEDKGDKVQTLISQRRMLLVIDDAWDIEDAEAFRLHVPNCAHIVTTRFPEIALDFADDHTQQVPELSPVDGLLLLKRLAEEVVEAEPEEANELVKAVGGLPLGLILMGRLLKKQGRNKRPRRIRKALDKLKQVEERLTLAEKPLRKHHPNLPKRAKVSLDAIIAVSYEALDEVSRLTLRALSVFLPKPNTFSEEAAEVVADEPVDTLDTLEDYGLLEGSAERYQLHQTIADYASLKCGGDEKVLFGQRAADYFAAFAQQHRGTEGYSLLDLDWRNISHSMEWAYEHKQWQVLLDGVQGLTDHNLGVVGFMDARGYWSNARELLPKGLEGAKALDDPLLKASMLTKMGAFAVRQSEIDVAEGHLQKSLCILKELPLSEDVVLQRTQSYEFMCRLNRQRDIQAAQKWVERGVAELEALPVKTDTVEYQKGYFYVLSGMMSGIIRQLPEAIEATEKGLALLPPSPTSARIVALVVLGNVYSLQGNINKSIEYQEEGIRVAKELGDSRKLASFWMNKGINEKLRGHLPTAISSHKKALQVSQKNGDVGAEGTTHNNLALTYIIQGDDEQALSYLTSAIRIAKTHRLMKLEAFAKNSMGKLQISVGQLIEAASSLMRANEICRRLELASLLPQVLYHQAEIARLNKEHDKAFALVSESLQWARSSNLLNHEGIGWSIKGKILDAMQRFDEAEKAHQTSLEILGEHYKYDIAQSQRALGEHYLMCDGEGSEQAKCWLTQALAEFERLGATRDLAQTKALLNS
ncbi:MAG: tetratricopeptide repeat protein [Ardenticatenaceae bacterium]